MKTDLYRDVDTEKIYTFSELKEMIIDNYEMDIEPTDDVIINDFINPLLIQNGGSIEFLNNSNDSLLKEINKQADDLEADRYLNQYERDMSVKEIYITQEIESEKTWYIKKYNHFWNKCLKDSEKFFTMEGIPYDFEDVRIYATELFESNAGINAIVGYYLTFHKDNAYKMWLMNTEGLLLNNQDKRITEILARL